MFCLLLYTVVWLNTKVNKGKGNLSLKVVMLFNFNFLHFYWVYMSPNCNTMVRLIAVFPVY